jgi:hypothetical protein
MTTSGPSFMPRHMAFPPSPSPSPRGGREPSSLNVARRAGAAGRGAAHAVSRSLADSEEGVRTSITDPSNGLRPVGHGLDSVYLTGRLPVPDRLLARLAKTRERLRESASDSVTPVRIAGSSFALSPKGSEHQFFASNEDLRLGLAPFSKSSRPNVQLVLSSALLWTHGGADALAHALEFVRRLIGSGRAPVLLVSRLDLACDVQEVRFPPPDDPRWVTRARHSARYDEGATMTGMQFGRDRILVRIYDKSTEVRKSRKLWLWELWLENGASDTLPVWRVEVQLRREALLRYGVDSIAAPAHLLGRLNVVWRDVLENWLTLRTGERVTRWDRAALAPAWRALAAIEFAKGRAAKAREPLRLFDRWDHVRQIRGHLASICAHEGIERIDDGLESLGRDLRELERMEPGEFRERLLARRAKRSRLTTSVDDDFAEAA